MPHSLTIVQGLTTSVGGCDGVNAAGLNWFKISEAGWDGHQWGSDIIHQTNRWTFNVPVGLAPG